MPSPLWDRVMGRVGLAEPVEDVGEKPGREVRPRVQDLERRLLAVAGQRDADPAAARGELLEPEEDDRASSRES